MKKHITMLFLCFFAINNFITAQTESETIDFLNTKLTAFYVAVADTRFSFAVSTTIDSISNKKAIQIDLILDKEVDSYFKILPEDVSSIEKFRAPKGNLILKIISPKRLILFIVEGEETLYERECKLIFDTTDEEVLKIKKALEHLFILNGATLIDDNLFKD